MQESVTIQTTTAKTLVGMWKGTISQDSVDHLVRVLERRTGAQIVAERQLGYVYVYTFGNLEDALKHFEMLSGSFCVR
jgi:hypothetical protein